MKVYVINLDCEAKRMNILNERLLQLGIEYERISAVYGKDLSKKEKISAVNGFRWWCAVGRPPTDGEIGCGLSHAKIYQQIINDNIPYACILEDDVNLDNRFPDILHYVISQISAKIPQVMLLSNHSESEGQLGNKHMGYYSQQDERKIEIRKTSSDFCAECYIINLPAAKLLLKSNYPLITPFDWWGRWRRLNAIELYHIFPTVATQNKEDFSSEILSDKTLPINTFPLCKYMFHKLKRLFGISVDRVCSFFE